MAINQKLQNNDEELTDLFAEALNGLRNDIEETNENVQIYYTALHNDSGGKELYGQSYNEALKIKGQARDRFLKFLALMKDRVTKKEDLASRDKGKGDDDDLAINHKDLNQMLSEYDNANLNDDIDDETE